MGARAVCAQVEEAVGYGLHCWVNGISVKFILSADRVFLWFVAKRDVCLLQHCSASLLLLPLSLWPQNAPFARMPGMSPTHCSHLSKHGICTHHLLLPSLWLCCHTLPHRIFCSRCYGTAHNPGDLQSDSALRSFTNPHQCTSPTHYNWNSHTRLMVTVALPSLNQADVPRYCHVNQKPMSVASCSVFSADPQGDGLLGLFSFIPYKSLYNGCKKFLG